MEKSEFVAALSRRLSIENDVAEGAVNATLAELVSPKIFTRPGEQTPALLGDNKCTNNCAERALAAE